MDFAYEVKMDNFEAQELNDSPEEVSLENAYLCQIYRIKSGDFVKYFNT